MAGDLDAQERLEKEARTRVGQTDSKIFWTATYCAPLIWSIFFIKQLMYLSFLWMVTAGVCFSLAMTNAQGYYNCRRSHKQKLTQYIQERGLSVFREATKSSLLPNFFYNLALPSFLRRGSGGDKV